MIRLDQICRENVQTVHGTEYILIDNFFDLSIFKKQHNDIFLSNYKVLDQVGLQKILSNHPLMDILLTYEQSILDAINKIWHESCVENKTCVNLTSTAQSLLIHNDEHWATVPVRGILYLNDVCGTFFHSDLTGNNPIEIGGKENQLLLFKVSKHSFHSVPQVNKDRFIISMMFDRVKG